VIYDDGSTDGTLEMLHAHPRVVVKKFERTCSSSFVESSRRLHDDMWKASRGQAHWVVVAAVDEHFHVPGVSMHDYLDHCSGQGVTLVPGLGYQMISDDFPASGEHLCQTRTWGAPCDPWNKLGIFDPHAIEETNYDVGRHCARPAGKVQPPAHDELCCCTTNTWA